MMHRQIDVALTVKSVESSGEFSGYGSVFGVLDSYGERVMPGAFRESLKAHKEKGTMPALLWQHNPSEPIGIWTEMSEDKKGLVVNGKLALKTQRGQEAHELLSMKAVRGLSIGFMPKKWDRDEDEDEVHLTEVDLWETSIVTFPANEAAQVEVVKQRLRMTDTVPTERELEMILRDAGLSRGQARALIAEGFAALSRWDADQPAPGQWDADLDAKHRRLIEMLS